MPRVLLTTLGTGSYVEGSYILKGQTSSCTPFIQEALAEILCRSWNSQDRIVVFCTEAARKTHWINGGMFDPGLESRLKNLSVPPAIESVGIPDGRSEAEIMEIFDTVYSVLKHEDEVILDITHSFRSLPLLNAVILNYSKVLKNIHVAAIYYGAFETLGPLESVRNLPLECRQAPVFDLTPYDTLLEWSVAVDDFARHGWTVRLQSLVSREVSPILRETRGKNETVRILDRLSRRLHQMGLNILTARCPEIEKFNSLSSLVDSIKGQQVIPPLNPLLDLLSSKTKPFETASPEEKGFEAVEWCVAHNLVPQGYTILRETLISGLCRLLDKDLKSRTEREDFVGSLLNVVGQRKQPTDWKGELADRRKEAEAIVKRLGPPFQDLADAFQGIRDRRNDINHGGCGKGCTTADRLIQDLGEKLIHARKAWNEIVKCTAAGQSDSPGPGSNISK